MMPAASETADPKVALVTGATSGIGRATARALAAHGFALVLCGRRAERLSELAAELGSQVAVLTRAFDVQRRDDVERALGNLPEAFAGVDVLVNNAGNAHGLAPFHEGDVDDWEAMVDTNLKGILYVSKCVSGAMVSRRRGHIVNIGSIAGREAYPGGNVYCATKSAVASLTDGMRLDLAPHGVKVSLVAPGLVETEFSLVRFRHDAARAEAVYRGYRPLSAEDVAEVIGFMVTRPAHVVLADVLLLPAAQASATRVQRAHAGKERDG